MGKGSKAAAGQAALDPVQFSATSQTPAAERPTVVGERKVSGGGVALEPVPFLGQSHIPAAERETVGQESGAAGGNA